MDKRKDNRNEFLKKLHIQNGNSSFACVALNISTHGIGLICDQKIPLGQCHVAIDEILLTGNLVYRSANGQATGSSLQQKLYHYGLELTPAIDARTYENILHRGAIIPT